MDAKLKRKWVTALRSGKYRQTQSELYNGKAYCCLGVLCRVVGAKTARDPIISGIRFKWGEDIDGAELPEALRRELKISAIQQGELTAMNDSGIRFPDIADYIDKNL